jgi:hypothetical protein
MVSAAYLATHFSPSMGKQYNKVEKKRRRLRYIDRKRSKAKAASASASKPKVRKSPVKKKEGAETAATAE